MGNNPEYLGPDVIENLSIPLVQELQDPNNPKREWGIEGFYEASKGFTFNLDPNNLKAIIDNFDSISEQGQSVTLFPDPFRNPESTAPILFLPNEKPSEEILKKIEVPMTARNASLVVSETLKGADGKKHLILGYLHQLAATAIHQKSKKRHESKQQFVAYSQILRQTIEKISTNIIDKISLAVADNPEDAFEDAVQKVREWNKSKKHQSMSDKIKP